MKLERLDLVTIKIDSEIPATIYANEQISLEPSVLEQIENFLTIEGLEFLAYTPDAHRGPGTPIGTAALIDRVYPQIPGNDLGCGMRFDVTDLTSFELTPTLVTSIRNAFFGGVRDVHVSNRNDLLAYGMEAELKGRSISHIPKKNKAHMGGALGAGRASKVLQSYLDIASTRDNFLGTIGGGNHFVEMQIVDEIVDRKLAYEYGLKVGSYCIMCHSGSLDLGQAVGIYYKEKAKEQHKGAYPKNGFFALDDVMGLEYIDAAYNAANFATVNRAVMASMLAEVLNTNLSSVYDSPHNLTWLQNDKFLHRKGACSAELNEPVLIPGSMGTRSCLAIGQGFAGTVSSSAHGAGRILNRNAARTTKIKENIDVITKIDLSRARPDIAAEVGKHIAEESPASYKDIEEVVKSSVGAGIIKPIAWMKPVFTIKG